MTSVVAAHTAVHHNRANQPSNSSVADDDPKSAMVLSVPRRRERISGAAACMHAPVLVCMPRVDGREGHCVTKRVRCQGQRAKAVWDQIHSWEAKTGIDFDGDGQVGLFCMRSPWRPRKRRSLQLPACP